MIKMLKKYSYLILGVLLLSMFAAPNQSAFAALDDTDGLVLFDPDPLSNPRGSYLEYKSCNPNANPALDHLRTNNSEKSCKGLGVDIDDYQVRVVHVVSDAQRTSKDLRAGDSADSIGATQFRSYLVGDKVCVFAFTIGFRSGVVARDSDINDQLRQDPGWFRTAFGALSGPDTNGMVNGVVNTNPTGPVDEMVDPSFPWHCLPVPEPEIVEPDIEWGPLVSDVCTDYDAGDSQFKHDDGSSRSFTGIVVQCIEETMSNLFTETDHTGTTFFSIVQNRLVDTIRALLALYIIVFGYQFMVSKKGINQEQWHWFILKFALVFIFATTPAMTHILPMLQNISKGYSLIVMEAGSGTRGQAVTAHQNLNNAVEDLRIASEAVISARHGVANNPNSASHVSILSDRMDARALALEEYNNLKLQSNTFGYRYCDFRDIQHLYPPGKEFMKLWDMVDCKIAKYLGVGDNPSNKHQPQMIIATLGMVFFHPGGLLVFVLSFVFLFFLVMVTMRIIHVYILASVGLMLLVYISPLIIPAALFKYTKSIFDGWLKQVVSAVIQPIILFGFLTFMFAAFDSAMFKGNHYFVPMTSAHNNDENKVCMRRPGSTATSNHGLCTSGSFSGENIPELSCDDNSAIGCMHQKLYTYESPSILGIRLYVTNANMTEVINYFLGMLMLIMIAYIANAVLSTVESISRTLTDGIGGGFASMAAVPSKDPLQIHKATTSKVGGFISKRFESSGNAAAKRSAVNAQRHGGKKDNNRTKEELTRKPRR